MKRGVVVNNIIEFNTSKHELIGKKVGTISLSMYRDMSTGLRFFYLKSRNKNMSDVLDVIEDTLYYF